MTRECEHRNIVLQALGCVCDPTCFCRTTGVCRSSDTVDLRPMMSRTLTPPSTSERPTEEMDPLVVPKRLEIDLDNPEGVAEFLDAVAESIRRRGRVVLIIE